MRARLHLRRGRIGFFREGSHDVCDARGTQQLLSQSCDVLDQVNAALGGPSAAVEGELELSENIPASGRAIHLETSATVIPSQIASLRALADVSGITLARIGQGAGESAQLVAGDPCVTDVLDIDGTAVTLRRHVLAFFQGNRYLLTPLVRHILDSIDRDAEVIDLYAGAGLFSVAAAVVKGARVTAVEGDRVSAGDLTSNAAPLGGLVAPVHRSVEEFTATARQSPAVVLVDPPRTGLSRAALDGALQFRARTLVYVSCDVATLARDARRILDAGYRLERLHGFDLFPNTPHVEAVALFRA
jgi:23S rRNA (uracil1939-C5)-methyltransferase